MSVDLDIVQCNGFFPHSPSETESIWLDQCEGSYAERSLRKSRSQTSDVKLALSEKPQTQM